MSSQVTRYKIRHITDYTYEDAASLSYSEARLLPRSVKTFLYEQEVHEATIQIEPGWNDYSERVDFYGNRVIYYTVRHPHERVVITASSEVQIKAQQLLSGPSAEEVLAATWVHNHADESAPWETVAKQMKVGQHDSPCTLDARQFCLPSPLIPHLAEVVDLAKNHFSPKRPVLSASLSLMEAIYTNFDFVADATDVATPISKVLKQKQGVCQDFAQIMIAVLRSRGLAARYMSGYIETLPPPGQEKLEGSDASHAWCSLYIPELGWIDFDPTNNQIPTNQHVILGWGRDFSDVSPIKGVYYGGSHQELDVSVDMKRKDGLTMVV